MSYEQDTDRMAGELLNLLKGSLSKPSSGSSVSRPQVPTDDNAMLSVIKDVLKKNLPPGVARPREQASAPAPAQTVSSAAQSTVAASEVQATGWEGLFRRQAQERELMHTRHDRERAEMHQRHVQEMESALGVQPAVVSTRTVRRTASSRPLGATRMPTGRTRMRGMGTE